MSKFERFPEGPFSMAEIDASADMAAPQPEFAPEALRMRASEAVAAINGIAEAAASRPRRRVERAVTTAGPPRLIATPTPSIVMQEQAVGRILRSDSGLADHPYAEIIDAQGVAELNDDEAVSEGDNRYVTYEEDGYDR